MRIALLALLGLAPAASAQGVQEYDLQVSPALSPCTFGGNTSLGPIQGNPSNQFRMAGLVTMRLGPPGGPFTTGEFVDGHIFSIPAVLDGKIPNPIPHLPPLAFMEVIDGVYNVISPAFSIDPAGNFSTTITMASTHGTLRLRYFGTTTDYSLVGGVSNPTTVSGTLSGTGSTYTLDLPFTVDYPFSDPGTGISGDVILSGAAGAQTDLVDPPLILRVTSLSAGFTGLFSVTGATPGAQVFLVYGLNGLGMTPVPQLGVTLGLAQPVQAGNSQRAGAGGSTVWTLPVPLAAYGLTVRLQAAQVGAASNIWLTTVQ